MHALMIFAFALQRRKSVLQYISFKRFRIVFSFICTRTDNIDIGGVGHSNNPPPPPHPDNSE